MELRTPISLITGSLGSGKTTLLRNILDMTDRRLAVLMNEFGEIPIDSQVIQGEHVQIVELAGGCACCALAGEFETAVAEIVERVAPELIVVEATGVADVLFKTVRCDVDMDLLFGLDIEKRPVPIVHHRGEDFESFTFTTNRLLARERFQQVVADLPTSVYRAKGFVRFAEGGYLFNYVVGR